jgi:hypothetical protein
MVCHAQPLFRKLVSMEIEGEEGKVSVVNSEDPVLEEGDEGKDSVVNSEDPLLEEGEEGKVSVDNSENRLIKVVADSDCISSSIQMPSQVDVTQQKGKHCYLHYKLLLV